MLQGLSRTRASCWTLSKKPWKSVVAVARDHCLTNKCVPCLCNVSTVGCASHRFNLAYTGIVHENQGIINKIDPLMVLLWDPFLPARLREAGMLKACISSPERWGFYCNILETFFHLKDTLLDLIMVSFDELPLSLMYIVSLIGFPSGYVSFRKYNFVFKWKETIIGEVWSLFRSILKSFRSFVDVCEWMAELFTKKNLRKP